LIEKWELTCADSAAGIDACYKSEFSNPYLYKSVDCDEKEFTNSFGFYVYMDHVYLDSLYNIAVTKPADQLKEMVDRLNSFLFILDDACPLPIVPVIPLPPACEITNTCIETPSQHCDKVGEWKRAINTDYSLVFKFKHCIDDLFTGDIVWSTRKEEFKYKCIRKQINDNIVLFSTQTQEMFTGEYTSPTAEHKDANYYGKIKSSLIAKN